MGYRRKAKASPPCCAKDGSANEQKHKAEVSGKLGMRLKVRIVVFFAKDGGLRTVSGVDNGFIG